MKPEMAGSHRKPLVFAAVGNAEFVIRSSSGGNRLFFDKMTVGTETLVTQFHAFRGRQFFQLSELGEEMLFQCCSRGCGIIMSAAQGFRDHFIDQVQFQKIPGGDFQASAAFGAAERSFQRMAAQPSGLMTE